MYGPARVIAGRIRLDQPHPATHGEDRQLDREEQNQDGTNDEGWDTDEKERGEHRAGVRRGVLPHRRETAQPNATERREEKGRKAERGGDRQGLGENLADRAVAKFGGKLKVALEQPAVLPLGSFCEDAEVGRVLLPQRAVEIVARHDLLLDGWRNLALLGERAARSDAHEQEGQRDDAKEHHEHRGEAAKNVSRTRCAEADFRISRANCQDRVISRGERKQLSS